MLSEALEPRHLEKPDWFNITEESKIYWTINCDDLDSADDSFYFICETESIALIFTEDALNWDGNPPHTVTLAETFFKAIKCKIQGVAVVGIRNDKVCLAELYRIPTLNFEVQ